MSIQTQYSIIFMIFALLQVACAVIAYKSKRTISKYTRKVNLAIIIPILANIVIIQSFSERLSEFGYYMSYMGMTAILLSMVYFTNKYCSGVDTEHKHRKPIFVYVLGGIDIFQLLCGLSLNHVFKIETIMLDGSVYYRDIPLIGLQIHRAITYVIYFCILLIYLIGIIKSSKLYKEKFIVIFGTMVLSGITQGIFVILRTPIDKSIIIHGIFGIVIFYFSLIYRPLRLLDTLLSNVASEMTDAVYIFDNSDKCVWANSEGYALVNVETDKPSSSLKEHLMVLLGNFTEKGETWKETIKADSNYYVVEKKVVKTERKYLDGYFLVVKDDTERHLLMEKEKYNSTHDSLTGLYNMQHLYEIIENKVKQNNKDYCIAYINIKNFKIVNDIFGRKFGDSVLKQFATWLRSTFKRKAYCSRLIGDTFGVFIPVSEYKDEMFLEGLSNFIVKNKNAEHQISFHIGIYDITDHTLDVSTMFDRAHLALSAIENNYMTCVKHYDDSLRETIIEEQQFILTLPEALEQDQIRPYLQPIVDKTGKIVGAEALARWIHPEYGFLPPIRFIPVFEKNGMIADVDKHIWQMACEILSDWENKYPDLFISINISPIDFYYINVVEEITKLTTTYNLNPSKLRIEITETAMMSDSKEKIKIFEHLQSAGFIVEMDDFGSGYSSLNLLKDMPVDVLKIDMNFLSIEKNDKSDTIIKNVINLSNDLNMTSLTEGVETKEQFDQLSKMGCELFQGYLFAQPMSVEDFYQYIEKNKKATTV